MSNPRPTTPVASNASDPGCGTEVPDDESVAGGDRKVKLTKPLPPEPACKAGNPAATAGLVASLARNEPPPPPPGLVPLRK